MSGELGAGDLWLREEVGSGKWRVESGEWKVGSGEWKVESGKWGIGGVDDGSRVKRAFNSQASSL